MPTLPPKRAAVIGGGILGVSTAVHLLRGGAAVVLITETELASRATGRSLSWLNSAGERSAAYHELRQAGIDRYRTLFAADPSREWLGFDGGLYWARPDAPGKTRARHAYEKTHGYASHLLARDEISAFTPNIDATQAPDLAVFNPGEGWVSLPHLVEFLMEEFHSRGGQLVTHEGKASVRVDNGRATGVTTESGNTYEADTVVVACGAQTPSTVAEFGVEIPEASPVSMLVVTEPVNHGVKSVVNTPRAALRPNPGNRLAVDHDWYEDQIVQHADGSYVVDDSVVKELLDEASKLIDGNPPLQPESWKMGLKPIPGDGEPVLGELEAVSSCFIAFTHSGATLGLIVGELLADEIVTGDKHPMLSSFRPDRFTT